MDISHHNSGAGTSSSKCTNSLFQARYLPRTTIHTMLRRPTGTRCSRNSHHTARNSRSSTLHKASTHSQFTCVHHNNNKAHLQGISGQAARSITHNRRLTAVLGVGVVGVEEAVAVLRLR